MNRKTCTPGEDRPADVAQVASPSQKKWLGMPPVFWIALVPGGALVLMGIRGLIVDRSSTNPLAAFKLLIGLSLTNDLVLIPVSVLLAVVVARLLPGWAAKPFKAGIFAASIVSVFALPGVNRWGAQATNATVLDRDYLRGLMEILILIAAITLVMSAISKLMSKEIGTGSAASP